MSETETSYSAETIEKKWQQRWAQERTFAVPRESDRPKYYVLEMFPYPSGRLHMGHVRNYSIGDVIARFKRARGYDVLHPMGWDAFGLPAENAARENQTHPADWTRSNIEAMRAQLQQLGLSIDWERELATCDADYYHWEQSVFLKMLERGLAYRKRGLLNWCDDCGTVLANEQVEDGQCWRGHGEVRQKELEQWYLRITDYADELLDCLDELKGWPSAVTTQQRDWIGKSHGAAIRFAVEGSDEIPGVDGQLEVFTTRPDTLYGCTFMSLAPEHPWTRKLAAGTEQEAEIDAFVDAMGRLEKAERMDEAAEKLGVFVGRYAINPVTGLRIPIYTANFVLADYGTGAVMAVPGHDQRDFEFATKYGIPKVVVIQPEGEEPLDSATMESAWTGTGSLVQSGRHDGCSSEAAKQSIVDELVELGSGEATVNYRLRDWGISRQRFWGAPVPVIHCEGCGIVPVPEEDLPVVLPEDLALSEEGGSPLPELESFWKVDCPKCGGAARRDTDTFDTFMESSWYFIRYCSPMFSAGMVDAEQAKRFLPVDQYIGGIEHAVMHLLYARFYTKVLRDLGIVDVDEPFTNLLCQGMVCHETYDVDGKWCYPTDVVPDASSPTGHAHKDSGAPVRVGPVIKMSKSKRNTVDPSALLGRYGADTLRLFCLFASPPPKDLDWSESGVEGAARYLARLRRLVERRAGDVRSAGVIPVDLSDAASALRRKTHQSVARVTDDIERRMQLNTAIAANMELLNDLSAFERSGGNPRDLDGAEQAVMAEAVLMLVRMLSPFAPHMANELWQKIGGEGLLEDQPWPEFDESVAAEDSMNLAVQVKGKKRGELVVPVDMDEESIKAAALALPNVQKFVGDRPPRLVKYIPGRLVTIVPS
jgi:leucyl-tRNA synthetase